MQHIGPWTWIAGLWIPAGTPRRRRPCDDNIRPAAPFGLVHGAPGDCAPDPCRLKMTWMGRLEMTGDDVVQCGHCDSTATFSHSERGGEGILIRWLRF